MKKAAVSLVLAVAWAPAWSSEAAPAIEKLVACADVQDSRQRLVCFDREIAPLAKAQPTSASANAAPAPVVRIAPAGTTGSTVPTPSLGEEQLSGKIKPPARDEEQALHARISALREVGPSTYVVSLDNGQAWRHEDQHQGSYLREGEAITISKAALGNYRLTRDAGASKNWIRVTRIR